MRSLLFRLARRYAWICLLGLTALPANAESVARYGISMADIPLTTGQPDRGAGAYQFTGHTLYDPLVACRRRGDRKAYGR